MSILATLRDLLSPPKAQLLPKSSLGEACFRVADKIEKDPHLFDFFQSRVPREGRSGCILGLVGQEMGFPTGSYIEDVSKRLFGMEPTNFYYALRETPHKGVWSKDARIAAALLRSFAQRRYT